MTWSVVLAGLGLIVLFTEGSTMSTFTSLVSVFIGASLLRSLDLFAHAPKTQ